MTNESSRRTFLILNMFGGLAVLGSYAWGMLGAPDTMASLWGGVPVAIRPLYTVNMCLSATGYFLFAPYIALRVDPARRYLAGRSGYSIFFALILLVMIPSALWLPLTSLMLSNPDPLLWAIIRIDLLLVGIGSLGLFITLLRMQPPHPRGRRLALLGLVPFCLQTAVLDALIWPAYFAL